MAERPLVSVVIPVYNRPRLIRRAVHSVLSQTYRNLDVIVVDDCSTDQTPTVLDRMSNERLRVLRRNENRGANAARNAGIEAARGRHLAFLDSDDLWHPEKLSCQVETLISTPDSTGVVYCGRWTHNNEIKKRQPPAVIEKREGDLTAQILRYNFLGFVDCLIDRRLMDEIGGLDEELPALQDWDFHIRLCQETEYAAIERPLVEVFPLSSGISSDDRNYIEGHKRILQKHRDLFTRYERAYRHLIFRLGSSQCLGGDLREGQNNLRRALEKNPGNPVYMLAFLCSLFGSNVFRMGQTTFQMLRTGLDRLRYQGTASGTEP